MTCTMCRATPFFVSVLTILVGCTEPPLDYVQRVAPLDLQLSVERVVLTPIAIDPSLAEPNSPPDCEGEDDPSSMADEADGPLAEAMAGAGSR